MFPLSKSRSLKRHLKKQIGSTSTGSETTSTTVGSERDDLSIGGLFHTDIRDGTSIPERFFEEVSKETVRITPSPTTSLEDTKNGSTTGMGNATATAAASVERSKELEDLLGIENSLLDIVNQFKSIGPLKRRSIVNLIIHTFQLFKSEINDNKRLVDLPSLEVYEKVQNVINSLISFVMLLDQKEQITKTHEQLTKTNPQATLPFMTEKQDEDEFDDSDYDDQTNTLSRQCYSSMRNPSRSTIGLTPRTVTPHRFHSPESNRQIISSGSRSMLSHHHQQPSQQSYQYHQFSNSGALPQQQQRHHGLAYRQYGDGGIGVAEYELPPPPFLTPIHPRSGTAGGFVNGELLRSYAQKSVVNDSGPYEEVYGGPINDGYRMSSSRTYR
ncbi:hypothetical protein CANARDRAFT_28590 [[Candida] arabinofermentans NRRL YB-2248]|uniref:Uncharacterized protein n=1 Tax=[Candida] arabinofermentans NRRL YB-2248 TaxID=983967 RepID=A0A1E4T0S6_9ASCO|nr:hypothetical protein CANARDRAFT_28590 [[Candida] arabinofermentans NRRL YB-2248]